MHLFTCAALAAHGSVWLAGHRDGIGRAAAAGPPVFQSTCSGDFDGIPSFLTWLQALEARGVRRIWLHRASGDLSADRSPEPRTTGVSGARIGLLTTGASPSERWALRSVRPDGAGSELSRCSFVRHPGPASRPTVVSVAEASAALHRALDDIAVLAAASGRDRWEAVFRDAARCLDPRGREDLEPLGDLVPVERCTPEALRLMASARRAWSTDAWNDGHFGSGGDDGRYTRLSAALYEAIGDACCAAVNDGLAIAEPELRGRPVNYIEAGGTAAADLPVGYRHLVMDGVVDAPLAEAAAFLFSWGLHRAMGLRPRSTAGRVAPGAEVVLRFAGLRVPCRVVWTLDGAERAGFAYGSQPGHPERGEAAFMLEALDAGRTRFTVRSFSRAGLLLTSLAGPVSRAMQRRETARFLRVMRDQFGD